ncbi:MAG: UPF0158 family protein [Proteiniphilum sp.]|uniref:UPF0158 family protein n=1 Tax=Proteiniphilum sp. TaxID=1926877 RepID=UPI002AB8816D|nr:UPF0158 family protein [Proteiniphilum sp.]MDY9918670.1 UPF0158 family protein [Proteiniphilum sp.]
MSTEQLLNECLVILRSIKDDKKSLEKLLGFMEEEFVEHNKIDLSKMPDYKLQVPLKYRNLISEVAGNMSAGLISFVNTETLEVEGVPKEIYSDLPLEEDDEEYEEEMTDTDTYSDEIFSFRKWKDFITIESLESSEAYRIMEYFVDNLPKGHAKNILNNTINGKKPFANFNNFIHQSEYRELWFEFRDRMYEKCVIDNYLYKITDKG